MSVTSLEESGLLTARQCAKHSSLSVTTIRKVIRAGGLPAKVIGRAVRVRREDLEAWENSLPNRLVRAS